MRRRRSLALPERDDDEDRAILRFLAVVEPPRRSELRILRPLQVSPIWLLVIVAVVFTLFLVALQVAMLGGRPPLF